MCHFETTWSLDDLTNPVILESIKRLEEIESDGLIELNPKGLIVTEKGKPFVRNVCMAFDVRLMRNKPSTQLFSMTI